MVALALYAGLFVFGLLGLVFVGIINRHEILERRLKDSIKQFNVIAISKRY